MSYQGTNSNNRLAAVFVDYDNLYDLLSHRLETGAEPGNYIREIINELRRYLLEADHTRVAYCQAYGEFSQYEDKRSNLENQLFVSGTKPICVPPQLSDKTAGIQLSVDATELLHRRPELQTFVFITGDCEYFPLVQLLKSHGRDVLVASLEAPSSEELPSHAGGDVFLDMMNLLSEDGRRELLSNLRQGRQSFQQAPPQDFTPLENPRCFETLELAEEYFGQYDEIYLTPLLRKLSEELGPEFDPKSIISELEEAGAVRLEKRDGYPYDYTVLIVNEAHPDVNTVHAEYYEKRKRQQDEQDYSRSMDYSAGDGYDGYDSEEEDYEIPKTSESSDSYDENYESDEYDSEEYETEEYDTNRSPESLDGESEEDAAYEDDEKPYGDDVHEEEQFWSDRN